ncbi:MAG: NAD-dependent epimerase/dehydratase family protein [Bacteroidetes bacterium]|nr:NAD-dependent epimerase/dehydratase family protein [Bacteroidota bacterium]
MKVFVTGGAGFLGSHVVRELTARNIQVRALVHSSVLLPSFSSVETVSGDLSDPRYLAEILAGCDAVIHCAAVISFRKSRKQDLFGTNATGTRNLVNASLEAGIRRFIHIGSIAAVGAHFGEGILTEDFSYNLKNLRINYSISKYHADREVMRGCVEGFEGIILSPVNIIGPEDAGHSTLRNLKLALKNPSWVPDGGVGVVDVRDVAWVSAEALTRGQNGQRYLLCAGNFSYGGYVDLVTGAPRKRTPIPALVYKPLGYLLEGMESLFGVKMPVTVEKSRLHHYFFWADGRKAEAEFGFRYRTPDSSMRETLDWYRKNHLLER